MNIENPNRALSIEQQETLALSATMGYLTRLSDVYQYHEQVHNRFNGYTFDNDDSSLLSLTALPNIVQRWTQPDNGKRLQSAEINFRTSGNDNTSTSIDLVFHFSDEDNVQNIITARLPKNDGDEDTLLIIDPALNKFKSKSFDLITKDEAYNFIVSMTSRNNDVIATNYLAHPLMYQLYLHNPFSLSNIHEHLYKLASSSRHETYHQLNDPYTGLQADITLAHIDDEFAAIEAEFWEDEEQTERISVKLGATNPPDVELDADEKDLHEFFGVKPVELPDHIARSPLRFQRQNTQYIPTLSDLEEINSRLESIVDLTGSPSVSETLDDYNTATGE